MQLASRIRQIPPSATLALNAKANQLKAQGVDIVNFGVGEPDFDTPDNIREAAIRAIQEGFTRYTPVGGTPELKAAIVNKFQGDYGLSYKPSEILVSCGGKHGLYNLFQVLFEKGDEVIIPGALLGFLCAHGHAGRSHTGDRPHPGGERLQAHRGGIKGQAHPPDQGPGD